MSLAREEIARRADLVRAAARPAIAQAMNLIESERAADRSDRDALVDALAGTPRLGAQVIGLTGPPGVGKSTLGGRLVAEWRRRGATVGVIAVDPSSRVSGGAVLGDRARLAKPAGDDGVFIRSMAARARLGGLAPGTLEAILVMRAAFDRVLVETVGVGQSETDVSTAADQTLVIVQPAGGDTLQFIKAGLMEIFDVLVVNKSDLGEMAERTRRELTLALGVLGRAETPIVLTSAASGAGLPALADVLDERFFALGARLPALRAEKLREHAVRTATEQHGTLALARHGGRAAALARLASLPSDAPPSALLAAAIPAV